MPIARNPSCAHCGTVPASPPFLTTLRSCEVDLTLDLAAPRTARSLVSLLLHQWGVVDEDSLDGATIVVSELVTNALVHCDDGGPVRLGVELHEAQLVLWVADASPIVPAQRACEQDDENGRGLGIVGQLALRWGVEPCPAGKRVFAELPIERSRCA